MADTPQKLHLYPTVEAAILGQSVCMGPVPPGGWFNVQPQLLAAAAKGGDGTTARLAMGIEVRTWAAVTLAVGMLAALTRDEYDAQNNDATDAAIAIDAVRLADAILSRLAAPR